ncbi:MAG TPA: hypothetical protein VFA38_04240 [Nitrospirales bacterium]|nr:hypothetical protein [Nitrospirales bacterium]
MSWDMLLGAWVATGLTLFILTFLYRDNPLFKLAEHLYVGISVGYTIVKSYDTVLVRLIYEPMVKQGDWTLLFPVAIGLLMLTRYVPKLAWLSRYAFAFVVGVGSGLAIPRVVSSYILKQMEDTLRPLVSMTADGLSILTMANFNTIVILLGVSTVLFYFFFSVEHSGPGRVAARTGIVFLMIAFGAAFGYTVMARMSLLIGRLTDLIEYSDARYDYATLVLLAITIAALAAWSSRAREAES